MRVTAVPSLSSYLSSLLRCDWANKIRELDDAASYSSALEVCCAAPRPPTPLSFTRGLSHLNSPYPASSISFAKPTFPFCVSQVCLRPLSQCFLVSLRPSSGSELMALSESVLVDLAPHLQLLLNSQAAATPVGTEGDVVQSAEAAVGDGATDAGVVAAPVLAAASDDLQLLLKSQSSNDLSFRDRRTGRRVLLALVAGGKLQSPKELRAQIKSPLEFMKAAAWFFARRSPGMKRHLEEPPPLLGHMLPQFSPCVPVRVMCGCVATACRRLATAPADMLMAYKSWSWAEVVMERVTRGRVRRVQVRLQWRACCAVRCACHATACVLCVFDACCRKRWLVLRCVAPHRSGRITRDVAFYSCVQAAAARVAGGPDILVSAENGDGAAVLCHVIADADAVNKRSDKIYNVYVIAPHLCHLPPPSAPHLF